MWIARTAAAGAITALALTGAAQAEVFYTADQTFHFSHEFDIESFTGVCCTFISTQDVFTPTPFDTSLSPFIGMVATISGTGTETTYLLDPTGLGGGVAGLGPKVLITADGQPVLSPTSGNAYALEIYSFQQSGSTFIPPGDFLDVTYGDTAAGFASYPFASTAPVLTLISGFDIGGTALYGQPYVISETHVTTDFTVTIRYAYGIATSAVPEPGTWALMIAGLGLAGQALRGRRGSRTPA